MAMPTFQPPVTAPAASLVPNRHGDGAHSQRGGVGAKRILVVDDNKEIRTLLKLVLSAHFDVFEAEDGVHALELARELKPDAVLLDVMMPGELDGLAVLGRIKSDPALGHAFTVMITARAQTADREAAERLGADAYFIKPFSPLELSSRIRLKLA
jgi:CheY-like chemotaxis protein